MKSIPLSHNVSNLDDSIAANSKLSADHINYRVFHYIPW